MSNLIRICLNLGNVDVFTFGESSLFGYDNSNQCLIFCSLLELNNLNDQSIVRFHFSSSPKYSIKKLILNENETILALISEQTAYLVYLPQSSHSSSSSSTKGSRLCPLHIIPSLMTDSTFPHGSLTAFLWLSSNCFMIVYSMLCECHLYFVRPSRSDGIEYIQSFSVGSSIIKGRTSGGTSTTKRISLHQRSNLVQIDLIKRKEEYLNILLIIAMKSDGDIFLLEIDEEQLMKTIPKVSSEFVGPIRILPSTIDNYGADHSQSNVLCLSSSQLPIVILTREKCRIHQCILLNPSRNEYHLFNIDSIDLPLKNNNQTIRLIRKDQLYSEIYYICDSLSNVYSIQISWINQIKEKEKDKEILRTDIEHLFQSNSSIEEMSCIQTNNKGQWLAIITKTQIKENKEFVFLRPCSVSVDCSSISSDSLLKSRRNDNQSINSSDFLDHLRQILQRDCSLPRVTLSSSSTDISDTDFERNLIKFFKIFSEEYIDKQDKVREILENKERLLHNLQETQLLANEEFLLKYDQIEQTFHTLNEQYQQEFVRQKNLLSKMDDLFSIIEGHTPVMSNEEYLMYQQLERYRVQMYSLKEKVSLLKDFILTKQSSNEKAQHINQSSIKTFEQFIQYYKDQIEQMKQQLQTRTTKN